MLQRENMFAVKTIGMVLAMLVLLGSVCEEECRVNEDENTGSTTIEERSPPPLVILSRQLEVCQGNRDKACDHDGHYKSREQHAIESVNLMSPDRREAVMQLNVLT